MAGIGFTGTQKGLAREQNRSLRRTIIQIVKSMSDESVLFAHHGDCVGGDDEFDMMVRGFEAEVVIHPPDDSSKRAHCERRGCFLLLKPLPYLIRDQRVVDRSDVMIGCPSSYAEKIRSGTWYTIRYARKKKKPLYIIYPDGKVMYENGRQEKD